MWFPNFNNRNSERRDPQPDSQPNNEPHPDAGFTDVEERSDDEPIEKIVNQPSPEINYEEDEENLALGNRTRSNLSKFGHEVVNRSVSLVSSYEGKEGQWECRPYKNEIMAKQITDTDPGAARRMAIIGALRDMGVKIFIIDSKSTRSSEDVLNHVHRVVGFVAKDNVVETRYGTLGFQRCLLYQDHQGRLFNLLLSRHSTGASSKYHEYLETFSVVQAMATIAVLCRSFPCATYDNPIENLQPVLIALYLGLVLKAETSLSFMNSAMLVQALPSTSAVHLTTPFASKDLIQRFVLFCLVLTGATSGMLQKTLALIGIGGACFILLANLGARSWHFLRWKPIQYDGPGASIVAYLGATVAGLAVPFLAHRNTSVGGKCVLEHVIGSALLVGLCFLFSNYDDVQQFLVIGAEKCDQDFVNFAVGIWISVTFFLSLILTRHIPYEDQPMDTSEQLLQEDEASPVGLRVVELPNYEINPALSRKGTACIPQRELFILGVIMSGAIGVGTVYLAYTNWEDNAADEVNDFVQDLS